MAAVSKKRSVVKSFDGEKPEADLDSERGKANDAEEETGICNPWNRHGRGSREVGKL